jgi:hypothetical protein
LLTPGADDEHGRQNKYRETIFHIFKAAV